MKCLWCPLAVEIRNCACRPSSSSSFPHIYLMGAERKRYSQPALLAGCLLHTVYLLNATPVLSSSSSLPPPPPFFTRLCTGRHLLSTPFYLRCCFIRGVTHYSTHKRLRAFLNCSLLSSSLVIYRVSYSP